MLEGDNLNATRDGGPYTLAHKRLRTTSATPVVARLFPRDRAAPDGAAFMVEVNALAIAEGSADAAAYRLTATFYKLFGGALTQVGTTTAAITHETAGAAAWDTTIAVSGSQIAVSVVGGAAAVTWNVEVRLWHVTRGAL